MTSKAKTNVYVNDPPSREVFLHTRLRSVRAKTRQHVEALLAWAPGVTARRAVVEDLHGLLDEIGRSDDATEEQRTMRKRREDAYVKAEAGRRILLVGLDRIYRAVDRLDLEATLGNGTSLEEWTKTLRREITEVHDQHRKTREKP
jgi:hypothetical protein